MEYYLSQADEFGLQSKQVSAADGFSASLTWTAQNACKSFTMQLALNAMLYQFKVHCELGQCPSVKGNAPL